MRGALTGRGVATDCHFGSSRCGDPRLVQTTFCLSVVMNGIAMSVKTSASLRKALAFRAVELFLRPMPRERNTTGSDLDREADGVHPGASGHGGVRASRRALCSVSSRIAAWLVECGFSAPNPLWVSLRLVVMCSGISQ